MIETRRLATRRRRGWPLPRISTGLALGVAMLGLALGLPRPAAAVEYEIFIDIDDEEELNDLQLTDQISDDTYETLIELMRKGVDLDKASREDLYALPNLSYEDVDRILAYRAEAGRIYDPAALVVAGVLSQRKLAALAIFVVVPEGKTRTGGVHGKVRYRTTYVAQDSHVPPMALDGRIHAAGNLTLGAAALLDGQSLGPVRWDPNRNALSASGDTVRPRLPKAFAQWDTARWGIIAGTYRIGFGQRLTFDNSRRYTPNGFYVDDAIVARYDTVRSCRESAGELDQSPCDGSELRGAPSYQLSPGMRGVAAGAKRLPLSVGWLQAYVFWSMQSLDLYQYRIYDRDLCQDPRNTSAECGSPSIFVKQDAPLTPTSTHAYRTLPNMVDIITQGANVGWSANDHDHIGLTGYGSIPRWRVDDANLDFKPSERYPRGGAFGAVGADFSWGRRWANIFGEVSRSVDQTPVSQGGGGGYAGILRHTASWKDKELEVSARYYDRRFANPYARPISARDRYEGNQARDEAGLRVRYTANISKRVDLRSSADVWMNPDTQRARLQTYARADAEVTPWWRPGLWLDYQHQDLSRRSFRQCTAQETPPLPGEEIDTEIICGGQRVQITARSRFQPIKRLTFTLQYRHEIQNSQFGDNDLSRDNSIDDDVSISDAQYENYGVDAANPFDPVPTIDDDLERFLRRNRLRQDINTLLSVVVKPTDALRLRARVRWFWEDIVDNTRLEQSVWTYFEVRYQIRRWAVPSLRYDVYAYLDDRSSTAVRRPNPEHWIRFQFESRF